MYCQKRFLATFFVYICKLLVKEFQSHDQLPVVCFTNHLRSSPKKVKKTDKEITQSIVV
jgi:hypothetical protein